MIAYGSGKTEELEDEPARARAASPRDLAALERDRIRSMICDRAYFLAERRGFEPGHDVDDWLQAEAEVLDELASAAV